MMLRQLLNGLAKRTKHSSQHVAVYEPQAIASGPSAHALAQQCCMNVAKRVQHHAISKMLHEKFDRFQTSPRSSYHRHYRHSKGAMLRQPCRWQSIVYCEITADTYRF